MEISVTSNTELLDKLMKNLSETVKVNVGAFGVDEDKAFQAEYGNPSAYVPELNRYMNIPPRSFLEVPLKEYLPDELKLGLNEQVLLDSSKAIGEQIGKDGKFIVDVAFETQGYGEWEKNDPDWLEYKQEHGFDNRVLHKTGDLASKIDYKVEK
jgi:hypothetical protein